MTIKEIYEYEKRFHKDIMFIGVYDPVTEEVVPETVDKYLETNADKLVEDYDYVDEHKCIVILG